MKKKVLSVLLATSMVVSLAACGSKEETTDNAAGGSTAAATETADAADTTSADDAIANLIAATEGTVDIQLWCSELEAYQTVMKELTDKFQEQYSGVDFNITIGAVSEADAKDKILEDIDAAADVFVFADDQVNDLVNAGALQEIAATYTYDPAETNSEATVAAATKDGKLYAYPLTASNGYFLYYDSNIFSEEDVASWEALEAKAEEAGTKVGMNIADGWYVYGFFAGAGCTLSMNEDNSNECDWNNETGLAVAESIENIASSPAFVNVADQEAITMLTDGTLGAYVSGTWNATSFQDQYGDGYAASKLPTFDVNGTATQMGSYAGYKFVGVNSHAKNVGWSMLLAEYLTNEESQLEIGLATADTVPSAKNCLKRLEVLEKFDYVGADDGVLRPKPEADMFLEFQKKFGLKPQEIAVVGDTYNDIRFARENGGVAIGVLSGVSQEADFCGEADYILNSVGELPQLLEQI